MEKIHYAKGANKMTLEKCPLCKSNGLNHGAEDWSVEGELSIEVGCAKSNCSWVGYIVYKIQFSRVEDLGGNRVG